MPKVKGVLPGEIPIRGERAHGWPTVRVQTKVCRGCGLHLGCQRGGIQFTPFAEAAGGSCGDRAAHSPHYLRRMSIRRTKIGCPFNGHPLGCNDLQHLEAIARDAQICAPCLCTHQAWISPTDAAMWYLRSPPLGLTDVIVSPSFFLNAPANVPRTV